MAERHGMSPLAWKAFWVFLLAVLAFIVINFFLALRAGTLTDEESCEQRAYDHITCEEP